MDEILRLGSVMSFVGSVGTIIADSWMEKLTESTVSSLNS